jgi:hypothetical protein
MAMVTFVPMLVWRPKIEFLQMPSQMNGSLLQFLILSLLNPGVASIIIILLPHKPPANVTRTTQSLGIVRALTPETRTQRRLVSR